MLSSIFSVIIIFSTMHFKDQSSTYRRKSSMLEHFTSKKLRLSPFWSCSCRIVWIVWFDICVTRGQWTRLRTHLSKWGHEGCVGGSRALKQFLTLILSSSYIIHHGEHIKYQAWASSSRFNMNAMCIILDFGSNPGQTNFAFWAWLP